MRNFSKGYEVIGTAALKSDLSNTPDVHGTIIEFPRSAASAKHRHAAPKRATSALRTRLEEGEFVQDLRYGTARGKSFNRVAPWQAAAAGVALSLSAFMAIFFGI